MENKKLSPKAASKSIHRINAWLCDQASEKLNLLWHELNQNGISKTKSEIVAKAIDVLYVTTPDYEDLLYIADIEPKKKRTTFYLTPQQAQDLWDIEFHWLGKGVKINQSMVVNTAIMSNMFNKEWFEEGNK